MVVPVHIAISRLSSLSEYQAMCTAASNLYCPMLLGSSIKIEYIITWKMISASKMIRRNLVRMARNKGRGIGQILREGKFAKRESENRYNKGREVYRSFWWVSEDWQVITFWSNSCCLQTNDVIVERMSRIKTFDFNNWECSRRSIVNPSFREYKIKFLSQKSSLRIFIRMTQPAIKKEMKSYYIILSTN
jgi:hypothetical protein